MVRAKITGAARVAKEFGGCPLSANNEALFAAFVLDYAEIVQLAVQEAVTRTDRKVFPGIRALARRAGDQNAVPQDLIAVHLSALAGLIHNKPHTLARACIRHSRLLLVKMIGELALYYRERPGSAGDQTREGSAAR